MSRCLALANVWTGKYYVCVAWLLTRCLWCDCRGKFRHFQQRDSEIFRNLSMARVWRRIYLSRSFLFSYYADFERIRVIGEDNLNCSTAFDSERIQKSPDGRREMHFHPAIFTCHVSFRIILKSRNDRSPMIHVPPFRYIYLFIYIYLYKIIYLFIYIYLYKIIYLFICLFIYTKLQIFVERCCEWISFF